MSYPWKGRHRKAPTKKASKRRSIETMGYKDLVPVLDREFSSYVRLLAADKSGLVRCVTCGSIHFWKQITLGHYISRSHHSVRWNLKNVAPQCGWCNGQRGGEQYKMRMYLVQRYGSGEVSMVEEWADMTKTETADTLRIKVKEYRAKVKELKKEKGL